MISRWLAAHSRFQMHFLTLDLYQFAEMKRYFYVEHAGRPVAMLSCLPILARRGYLFEDLIRDPDAPNGSSELMVLEAIERFRDEGVEMATFGLSPRLGLDAVADLSWFATTITRLGMAAATRLSAFHKLYHYRKKFHTRHSEPCYLVKFPPAVRLRDVWGILTAFNIL
jgi:phosphatidylglycerol lysyltransferase